MNIISRLLRKNVSRSRLGAFVVSNLAGLIIIIGALQFYFDVRSLWSSEDSFLSSDFIIINKRVTAEDLWSETKTGFSESEISELRAQPWVRDVGSFSSSDFRVNASVSAGGGRGMSTMLFFESVPDSFVDVKTGEWGFREGDMTIPVIISKDYLALYNFGFAGSAGLPQMSEELISSIPLQIELISEDGSRREMMKARIAGFSDRLNTILVPESFLEWSNRKFGSSTVNNPNRLIINVSSPGDVAIEKYLEEKGYEAGGNGKSSSASFMLRVVVGMVVVTGLLITVLSFFILLLSVSLIMEKNRDRIHTLLLLGVPLSRVGAPYIWMVSIYSLLACLLAIVAGLALRAWYLEPVRALGATGGNWWIAPSCALTITLLLLLVNISAIRKKVIDAWR